MLEEIYRPIEWTGGKYSVSNKGNVYNNEKNELVEQYFYKNGYLGVFLYIKGKQYKKRVHRLVAECFIGVPSESFQINHKDENKTNNNVENLEWITSKDNKNYGTRNKRISESLSKAVNQYELNGAYIRTFKSATEAECFVGGCGKGSCVIKVCKGKRNQYKGYKWSYSI